MYAESRLKRKLYRPAAAGRGGYRLYSHQGKSRGIVQALFFSFVTKSGQMKQTEAEHVENLQNQMNILAPFRGVRSLFETSSYSPSQC